MRGVSNRVRLGYGTHAVIYIIRYLSGIITATANEFIGSSVDVYGNAFTVRCSQNCALLLLCVDSMMSEMVYSLHSLYMR